MNNNEKRQGLDKYEGEGQAEIYFSFFFIALLLLPQKESNLMTDLAT